MNDISNNFYELIQQLRRIDRKGTAILGKNTYEIHIGFNSYVSLYLRIISCDRVDERITQLTQLHEVLKFLLLPDRSELSCCHGEKI